ncbi:MAG: hypothetical protein IJP82_04970 [Bacteroidaceae bacterium]|nr:hypothetical protein [Bacteroidaceae bacterium]
MRKMHLEMLAAILSLCAASIFTSCHDDDNNSSSTSTDIEQQKLEEWEPCNKLTYIAGIDNEDIDLQAVIRDRFPNQTQSLSNAEVAFVDYTTAFAHINEMDDFYDRGGLIVMMRPTGVDFEKLSQYIDDDDDEDGYIGDDNFDVDELFSNNDQMEEVFYAYNKYEKHYTMYEEQGFDGNYTDEINEMSAEEWESIRAYNEQFPADSELDSDETLYDNDYDQNYNYYQARLDPFIDFIEEIDQQTKVRSTRAGNDDEMKLSVEDGYFFVKDMPISLNHKIEKDYTWNKNSTVTIKYWISSAYMLSCNGQNKAGDYYMVKSEITPHIKPLWEVAAKAGGWFSWGRCRIYAYWFDNMNVEFKLLDANNQSIANNIQYYKHPIPDNENTENSYSNGFSWGINGAVTGEIGKEGPKAQASVGFSLEWSSDVSYSLKTIQYERNTSSTYPTFRYWTNNVKLADDDYENEEKTNANFPAITHTEFSTSTAWIWRVPRNSSLGVDDNASTHFNLCVSVKPVYASWYHWRGAVEYNSNKKTYNGYNPGNSVLNAALDGWFTHTETLPAPDRTPWGVVALKNAASSYTVGNIKIYKQSDFTSKGTNAPVYATISSSYNANEVAKKFLPEGIYALTFQAIDPNQGNKVVGNWKYENIKVNQGQSAADATTEISTINAQEIK